MGIKFLSSTHHATTAKKKITEVPRGICRGDGELNPSHRTKFGAYLTT